MNATETQATETTIPPRPTRPAKAVPTFSHAGQLGLRDYDSFNSYWKGDGPPTKKVHACNPVEGKPGTYKALCGKRVVLGHRDFVEDHPGGTRVWPAGAKEWISCRGCKRKLAGG